MINNLTDMDIYVIIKTLIYQLKKAEVYERFVWDNVLVIVIIVVERFSSAFWNFRIVELKIRTTTLKNYLLSASIDNMMYVLIWRDALCSTKGESYHVLQFTK